MNRIMTTVAMAILFAVNLVACGRSEQPTPTTQPVSTPNVAKTKPTIKEMKDRVSKFDEEREQRDKERRQQVIEKIRQAFDLAKEPERDLITGQKQPAWMKDVTSSTSAGAKACAYSKKFDEMATAFGYLQRRYEVPGHVSITWEEIGANAEMAREVASRYRELGLIVASSFVEVFKMPRPTRAKVECGTGEGSFDLADTERVMRVIVNALAEVNETPAAIKQTPQSLRAMLRKDFTDRLAEIRKDIAEGRASESDGMGNFLYVSREAVEEWKFSHEELKLTKQEMVAYGDYRRRW